MTGAPTVAGRAPGPPGRLVFGSLADVQRDPIQLLTSAHAQYGDVVRFRYLGPRAWHLFVHPAHVEEILVSRQQEFPKGVFARVIDVITPGGVLTAEGDEWARQRRLLQPAFSAARVEGYVEAIASEASEVTARWDGPARRGAPIDLGLEMMRLSLLSAGRTLFSSDLRDHASVEHYVRLALAQLDRRVRHPLSPLPFLPTPSWLAYRAAARRVDGLVNAIVDARRRGGAAAREDVLDVLLGARDAGTGEPLTGRQVRDQVKTLLVTSYETTAQSLAWMLHRVAAAPAVRDRVRAEVRAVVAGDLPTYGDLKRLTYARQVVDETLRLYPSTFWLGRQARHACQIGGCAIPRGGVICISPYVTHRHPAFWTDPEDFDPDRFEPARAAARPRGSYFPFGLGPRYCIGQQLALTEMLVTLAIVAARWTLTPAGPAPVRPEARGTLRPSAPLVAHVAKAPA
jgi:cytochrome P450